MSIKKIIAMVMLIATALTSAAYFILTRFDYNRLKPQIIDAVRQASGRELILDGKITLKLGVSPKLVARDARLTNPSWAVYPDMAKIKRLEIKAALIPLLKGDVRVKRLIIAEPDIFIETSAKGESNLSFHPRKDKDEKNQAPGKKRKNRDAKKIPSLLFNDFQIKNGTVSYLNGATGRVRTLRIQSFTASALDDESPVKISLNGTLEKMTFNLSGKTGSLDGLMNPKQPWPLTLSGAVMGVRLNVSGSVKNPLSGSGIHLDFQLNGEKLSQIQAGAIAAIPLDGPFALSGKINAPTPGKYELSNLTCFVGKNDARGSVNIDLSGKKPFVNGSLVSERMDISPFFRTEKEPPKKNRTLEKRRGTPEKSTRLFSKKPLPFDRLNKINADMKIKIKKFASPKINMESLFVHATLKNGVLLAKSFEASMAQSHINQSHINQNHINGTGRLEFKKKSASVSADVALRSLDINHIMPGVGMKHALEGELDMDISVRAVGSSIAEWMGGLSGNARAVMKDGRMDNRTIKILGQDLTTGLFSLLNPAKEKGPSVEIDCFVGLFDFQGGMAKIRTLVLDTPVMGFIGDGRIDLKTESIDATLQLNPKGGIGTKLTGKIGISLGELTRTFRIRGTLAKPSLHIDTTHAISTIGKAIGGVALFGPIGAAAALLSGKSGNENPCENALKTAEAYKIMP